VRRIRYSVATSLDGFIAGPDGQFDWIIMDPEIDFEAIYDEFDTILMGRRSYEVAGGGASPGIETIVVSKTLRQKDHPNVTIVSDRLMETLTALKRQAGKDIWLWGGGQLFRSLLDLGLVDTVEIAVMPVVLGQGIPLLPPPFTPTKLKLTSHKIYKSGIVGLNFVIQPAAKGKRNPKSEVRGRKSGG
jgi:dihydrofolate reductase